MLCCTWTHRPLPALAPFASEGGEGHTVRGGGAVGRTAYLQGQKAAGRKVAAVWPARYPAELLWAHGVCPAEVWDPPAGQALAGAHLQSYVCGIVRQGLELLLSGGLTTADILLFPHTCDSIQNLGSLVRDLVHEPRPCLYFYPPRSGRSERAAVYLEAQLRTLSADLTRIAGPLRDGALEGALALGNGRAAALRHMYDLRARGALDASNEEFYGAVRTCEYLWPEDAVLHLEAFMKTHAGRPRRGVPLVLSGVLPAPSDLAQRLDGLSVAVVEDDLLACGRRFARALLPEPGDPWRAMAARLLALPPCSTAGDSVEDRASFLAEQVERTGGRGVLVLALKFCEPELFQIPSLVDAMRGRGIPVLAVETELGNSAPAGMMTRVEAFLESLP